MTTDFFTLERERAKLVAAALQMRVTEVDALLDGFNYGADKPSRGTCVLIYPDDNSAVWAYDLGRALGSRANWRHN